MSNTNILGNIKLGSQVEFEYSIKNCDMQEIRDMLYSAMYDNQEFKKDEEKLQDYISDMANNDTVYDLDTLLVFLDSVLDERDKFKKQLDEIGIIDEIQVCSHYLSYLINNDDSGLSKKEILTIDNYFSKYKDYHIEYIEQDDNTFFTKCVISELKADCVTIQIRKNKI